MRDKTSGKGLGAQRVCSWEGRAGRLDDDPLIGGGARGINFLEHHLAAST